MSADIDMGAALRAARKETRELRKGLMLLTLGVRAATSALDVEMLKPSDVERGKRIAAIINKLDLQNDSVRRFTLGILRDRLAAPLPSSPAAKDKE